MPRMKWHLGSRRSVAVWLSSYYVIAFPTEDHHAILLRPVDRRRGGYNLFAELVMWFRGLHTPGPQIKSFCYWQQPDTQFIYLCNHGDEVTKAKNHHSCQYDARV